METKLPYGFEVRGTMLAMRKIAFAVMFLAFLVPVSPAQSPQPSVSQKHSELAKKYRATLSLIHTNRATWDLTIKAVDPDSININYKVGHLIAEAKQAVVDNLLTVQSLAETEQKTPSMFLEVKLLEALYALDSSMQNLGDCLIHFGGDDKESGDKQHKWAKSVQDLNLGEVQSALVSTAAFTEDRAFQADSCSISLQSKTK